MENKKRSTTNFFILALSLVLSLSLISAVDFTPQGNINLRDVYNITGAPFVNATIYYGDGSQLTGITSTNANSSDYWDDMNTINTTQMENNGGTLNILISWFNTQWNIIFGTKTTDDLTEGSINLYDNQSWNETRGDDVYVNVNGDTWEGDMSAGDYNLTDIQRLIFNTTGCSEESIAGTLCWNDVDMTLNIVTGLGNVIQVGQEQWALAKNGDSQLLLNGQIVTLVGSSGDRGLVARADASNMSLSSRLSVVTIDSCAVNADCPVTTFGRVVGLNTNQWAAGTLLYLSADGSGNLTSTVPDFPNFRVLVAFVIRSHVNAGIIFVQPQIDYTDGVTLNDLYIRDNLTVEDDLIVGSIILQDEQIIFWDNITQFVTNILLTDGSRSLISNWNQGVFNFTNVNSWFLGKIDWSTIQNKFLGSTTDDITEGSINLYDNQSWNESHADTLYYDLGNSFGYWNDTYATFNKTYADTLYLTGQLSLFFYNNSDTFNSSYTVMNTTINPTLQIDTFSGLTDGDNLLAKRILSSLDLSILETGAYNQHTTIDYTSGSKDVQLRSTLHVLLANGTEIQIGASPVSPVLATGTYQQIIWTGIIDTEYVFSTGDYLTMYLYAFVSGGGGAPTLDLVVGGSTSARLDIGINPNDISTTEVDPFWTSNSSTVARIGDCPSGQVIQNTTISGVECVVSSVGTVTSVATDDTYLTGGPITSTGTITFSEALAGTSLAVNSSDYWDNLGTPIDITSLGTIGSATSITSSVFVGPLTGNADTATSWDGETSQANLNVNSSNFWDALNTVADILGSLINNDLSWINQTQSDLLYAPISIIGTVTNVAAGNGMDFTSITGSGSVTMGLPGSLTAATSNALTSTSHTHAVSGFLESLVGDTTPQLGGYLDTNGNNIGSTTDEIENIYVGDTTRIYFGDGQDASIYFNGTNLIITG